MLNDPDAIHAKTVVRGGAYDDEQFERTTCRFC